MERKKGGNKGYQQVYIHGKGEEWEEEREGGTEEWTEGVSI